MPKQPTFEEFVMAVRETMEHKAVSKGYNPTGIDGPNQLFDFVSDFAGDGHSLGEIVYKAKRYASKRDTEDLVKIAAWAFLAWRYGKAKELTDI